jgi:hypothetical protein
MLGCEEMRFLIGREGLVPSVGNCGPDFDTLPTDRHDNDAEARERPGMTLRIGGGNGEEFVVKPVRFLQKGEVRTVLEPDPGFVRCSDLVK